MVRQALIPGSLYINETSSNEALIPKFGYVNETITAGVSISRQITIPFEIIALGSMNRTLRLENLSFVTQSRTQQTENLIPLSRGRSMPLSVIVSTSKGRSSILEYLAFISKGRILPYEIAGNILAVSQSRTLLLEILMATSKGRATLLDYLVNKSGSNNVLPEYRALVSSLGREAVHSFVALMDEAPISLLSVSIDMVLIEYLVRANISLSASLEILKGIAVSRIPLYEWAGAAQITITGSHTLAIDWRTSISGIRTVVLDFLKIVSQARSFIFEWTQGLSVTLDPSSLYANILKSLNKYLVDNLITTEGLSLDWGQPNFKEEGLERWLQTGLLWGDRTFIRQADNGGQQGNLIDVQVEIDLFERYPARRNLYAMDDDKDTLMEYLTLAVIPIYDFTTAGKPQVGELRLYTLSNPGGDESIEDGGEESGLRQEKIVFPGRYLEKFTKV